MRRILKCVEPRERSEVLAHHLWLALAARHVRLQFRMRRPYRRKGAYLLEHRTAALSPRTDCRDVQDVARRTRCHPARRLWDKPPLEALAKFGLAIFLRLSDQSVQHHLPIILST